MTVIRDRYLQAEKMRITIKLSIILIFGISIPTEIYACTCSIKKLADWQKSELENSECIFIGEVIKVNNDLTYEIKVTESLDGGDAKGNIYIGQNWKYCSPYVENKGKWIIYGRMENGFLKMNMCGISRPFENPMVNPIPPPPELYENKISESERNRKVEKLKKENFEIAIKDLKLEINALRKRRDQE